MKIIYPTEKEINASIENILNTAYPQKAQRKRHFKYPLMVAASLLLIVGVSLFASLFFKGNNSPLIMSAGAENILMDFDEILAGDSTGSGYTVIDSTVGLKSILKFDIHTYGNNIETITYKMEKGGYFAISNKVSTIKRVKEKTFDEKYFNSEYPVYSSYTVDYNNQFPFSKNATYNTEQYPLSICISAEQLENKEVRGLINRTKSLSSYYGSLDKSAQRKMQNYYNEEMYNLSKEIVKSMPKHYTGYATATFQDGTTQTKKFKVKCDFTGLY